MEVMVIKMYVLVSCLRGMYIVVVRDEGDDCGGDGGGVDDARYSGVSG